MQTMLCSDYLQKLTITKININSEYIGADSGLSTEILHFLAFKPENKAGRKICNTDNMVIGLDEYELAMAG